MISGQNADRAFSVSHQARSWLEARLSRPLRPRAGYHPSHSDAHSVEPDHRGSKKAHVQDVGGRCNDCCENKNGKYGISQIAPHPASRNHPHQSEEEDENGHFENQPEPDDDR